MPLAAGTRLGPYEITALIGTGGMGEVYKARDTRLDRTVAIKVSREEFSERFAREARSIAALNHPHICALYDVGSNYLVMEFIDGVPLKGPMPPPDAVRLASQIAEALEAAHQKNIVHRDLKPANILVTSQGVKLLDFGVAKVEPSSEDRPEDRLTQEVVTRAGTIVGTPTYMAPEQWAGKTGDARSDIYAFGGVFYEMLTGVPAGRERTPLKDAALEAIVRRCLANDPAQRFQSAAELKSALSRALKGGRTLLYASAAAALLLIVIAGGVFWFRPSPRAPAPLTDQDVLVVADFDNNTGDPVFDSALRQALAFQLQQSPFLKAMDDEQIREALRLAGRSPDERLTGQRAREVCVREGEKATLEGSISRLGSTYLLALQAVNCQTGETLAREQAEAADKEHVVEALGRATGAMRAKLGESLGAVQGEERVYTQPLTTSSLEALQAFHMGDVEFLRDGSSERAIPHFRHATELDPNFAMAFAVTGVMYDNVRDFANAREFIEKAYSLSDRVRSERERLFILAVHYQIAGDVKKQIETYEVLSRTYPRDPIFHGNLGVLYIGLGQVERGLTEAEAAIRNGPKMFQGYALALGALERLNRPDDAKAIVAKAFAEGLENAAFHAARLRIAYVQNDPATAEAELKWFAGKPEERVAVVLQTANALALGQAKRARSIAGPAPPVDANNLPAGADLAAEINLLEREGKPSSTGAGAADDLALKKIAGEKMPPDPGAQLLYAHARRLAAEGKAAEAAEMFQKILNNRYRNWGVYYPLAYVGLARTSARAGDTARAKKAYEDFFALWKDAEPDVPLLAAARKEAAALH